MPSLSAVLLGLISALAGIGLQTIAVAIRDKRREDRDARAAARITANDFDRAARYMGGVAELGAWWDPQTDLSIPAWDEHRTLLARVIDDELDWLQLERAVRIARDVENEAHDRIAQGTQRVTDDDRLILREEVKEVRGPGYARLRILSEERGRFGRMRKRVRRWWRHRRLKSDAHFERTLDQLFGRS